MNTKALVILIVVAALISAAALMLNRAPSATPSDARPALLLPELQPRINDVASIEIRRPSGAFSIIRAGADWTVASKGGFPARLDQVKAAIIGLAELKPLEAKTSNPTLYARLGVQDPASSTPKPPASADEPPPTEPTLVVLKDAAGDVVASVILGTQKWGTPPTLFVRKVDDKQSWLVEGDLQVPTEAMDWVERQILNIPRERIQSVEVVHPADRAEFEISRTDPSVPFTVRNMPAGRELTSPTAPESLVTGVQFLSIEDVRPAADSHAASFDAITTYRTFDGLVIAITSRRADEKNWMTLDFRYEEATGPLPADEAQQVPAGAPSTGKTPQEVKKEAEELHARLSKWTFAVPEYKSGSLRAKLDDFLKPLAPTPADAPDVANPNGPPGVIPPAGPESEGQ